MYTKHTESWKTQFTVHNFYLMKFPLCSVMSVHLVSWEGIRPSRLFGMLQLPEHLFCVDMARSVLTFLGVWAETARWRRESNAKIKNVCHLKYVSVCLSVCQYVSVCLSMSRLVIENVKRKKMPGWHHQWIWALWQTLIMGRCVLTSGTGIFNSTIHRSGLGLIWELLTVSGPMRGQGFAIFEFSQNQKLGLIFP